MVKSWETLMGKFSSWLDLNFRFMVICCLHSLVFCYLDDVMIIISNIGRLKFQGNAGKFDSACLPGYFSEGLCVLVHKWAFSLQQLIIDVVPSLLKASSCHCSVFLLISSV